MTERRNCRRIDSRVPMVWQLLTSDLDRDVYSGTVINYARHGLYFETDRPLGRRSIIWVRVDPRSLGKEQGGAGLLPVAAVEVKWCRELSDGSRLRYGIGAKYC